jgi:hypothetical protein
MEELLDAKQVKKILNCSMSFVYKLVTHERLPCVRIKGLYENGKRGKDVIRFKESDIWNFIDKHYQT